MSVQPGDQDPRGELVRPFALTRGQAQSIDDIALEAVLVTTPRGREEAPYAGHHKHEIAQLCVQPQSLAEISAHLHVPLGVANVLVTDMVNDQMLTLHQASSEDDGAGQRLHVLERVLEGLRRL